MAGTDTVACQADDGVILVVGLWLFGTGEALLVDADLGVSPWTVLAQGIGKHLGIGIGWATFLISALVLLFWIPLRESPVLAHFPMR